MRHCVSVVAFCHVLLFSNFIVSAQSTLHTGSDYYLANLYENTIVFDTSRAESAKEEKDHAAENHEEWKQWRTVENYFYGKNRGSLPMIADLQALHPYFRDKVIELIQACKSMGIELAVVESYRTHAKQAEYYAMGKKYTSTPGGKSRHQYGLAVDVVPVVDSVAVWNNPRLWRKIGMAGERLGLRWGGRWRVLYDPGHFEWVGGLSRQELEKGLMPTIPSAHVERYPSLEEELMKLQKYWEAWQVEQAVIAGNRRLSKRP